MAFNVCVFDKFLIHARNFSDKQSPLFQILRIDDVGVGFFAKKKRKSPLDENGVFTLLIDKNINWLM